MELVVKQLIEQMNDSGYKFTENDIKEITNKLMDIFILELVKRIAKVVTK